MIRELARKLVSVYEKPAGSYTDQALGRAEMALTQAYGDNFRIAIILLQAKTDLDTGDIDNAKKAVDAALAILGHG